MIHDFQDTHYVRCIKSNEGNQAGEFDNVFVQKQLSAASVIAYIDFIRLGFPSRLILSDVYNNYKLHLSNHMLNQTLFCRNLLLSLGLKQTEFIFGTNCVFLRTKYNQLVTKMKNSDNDFIVSSLTELKRFNNSRKLWNHSIIWTKLFVICECKFISSFTEIIYALIKLFIFL